MRRGLGRGSADGRRGRRRAVAARAASAARSGDGSRDVPRGPSPKAVAPRPPAACYRRRDAHPRLRPRRGRPAARPGDGRRPAGAAARRQAARARRGAGGARARSSPIPRPHVEHAWFADVAAALLRAGAARGRAVRRARRAGAVPVVVRRTPSQGALDQMAQRAAPAERGARRADAGRAQGYGLPIGGVLATEGTVIPYAVGVDIACRMKLTVLDLPRRDDRPRPAAAGAGAAARDAVRRRRQAARARAITRCSTRDRWAVTPTTRVAAREGAPTSSARAAPATTSSSSASSTCRSPTSAWRRGATSRCSRTPARAAPARRSPATTRSSRATLHPELPRDLSHLAWLDLGTEEGDEYWAAMSLMGDYAAANHAVIHRRVARHLKAERAGRRREPPQLRVARVATAAAT